MANPVFSAQFINYSAETPNNAFIVPDGFTAVCRYAVASQELGSYNWVMQYQNGEESPGIFFHNVVVTGAYTTNVWEGRVVVPAGGIITAGLADLGTSPYMYLGGYLLRNG